MRVRNNSKRRNGVDRLNYDRTTFTLTTSIVGEYAAGKVTKELQYIATFKLIKLHYKALWRERFVEKGVDGLLSRQDGFSRSSHSGRAAERVVA
jgi:hypothetical protein